MRRSDQRTGRRSIAPIRIRHLSINVRSIQLSHHIQDFIICGNFLFIPTDVVVYRRMEAGGDEFLNVVLAENFARFLHLNTPEISYDLGHENGVWYNFMTLAAGFIPWTIFFFFSLFGLKLSKPEQPIKEILKNTWKRIRSMEKVRLFSLVALIGILFFYSIPSSKRSVYLMPAYPFIALFLAQYALYITEYRTKVTRVFAAFSFRSKCRHDSDLAYGIRYY